MDWIEVENVPFSGAPTLPEMPAGYPWPGWTRQWWERVSSMPHCILWAASDWEFALDTALLKAEFHAKGGGALAAEIRNRERVLGTTVEFRRGLRIRYVDPKQPADPLPADVTSLDDYREL